MKQAHRVRALLACLFLIALPLGAQEVIVLNGTKDTISWLKAENFWGEEKRGEQLQVPRAIITGISPGWQKNSAKLPVSQKKEIFYRLMLPLVVNANTMVLEHRADLGGMDAKSPKLRRL